MRFQGRAGSCKWPELEDADGKTYGLPATRPRCRRSRISHAGAGSGTRCERPAFVVGSRHVRAWRSTSAHRARSSSDFLEPTSSDSVKIATPALVRLGLDRPQDPLQLGRSQIALPTRLLEPANALC